MKLVLAILALAVSCSRVTPQVVAQTATVNLTWTASATAGVSYNVYRENAAGACTPIATAPACTRLDSTPISALTYTDSPAIGSQYFYVVRAVNSIGIEAVNSNEVSVNLSAPAPAGVLTCNLTIVNGVAAGTCK